MQTSRGAFLSAAAATIAAAAFGVPAAAAAPVSLDAFLAIANKPARHREVFAATRPSGYVFAYMRNALNGYEFGWNEPAGSLHAVAVFNGLGVLQGLDDDAWRRYRLGDALVHAGGKLPAGAAAGMNPWYHAPAGLSGDRRGADAPFNNDASIQTLQARGCDFFVCNTALRTAALAVVAAGFARDAAAVHADLSAALVPGAVLVPSGVSAIGALQEQRFTFYDANV